MPYYVYVLKSTNFNRRYIGSCEDLHLRLQQHNSGKVRSSKAYKPYELAYSEIFQTRSEAFKREQFFKTLEGYNFLKSINIYR
jgi:putative endonuclease